MSHDHHNHVAAAVPTSEAVLDRAPGSSVSPSRAGGPLAAVWNAVTAVIATVMGLAPHVLHHIGLFAGAAFVVGPAISSSDPVDATQPAGTRSPAEHSAHHSN